MISVENKNPWPLIQPAHLAKFSLAQINRVYLQRVQISVVHPDDQKLNSVVKSGPMYHRGSSLLVFHTWNWRFLCKTQPVFWFFLLCNFASAKCRYSLKNTFWFLWSELNQVKYFENPPSMVCHLMLFSVVYMYRFFSSLFNNRPLRSLHTWGNSVRYFYLKISVRYSVHNGWQTHSAHYSAHQHWYNAKLNNRPIF